MDKRQINNTRKNGTYQILNKFFTIQKKKTNIFHFIYLLYNQRYTCTVTNKSFDDVCIT